MKNETRNIILAALIIWVFFVALIYAGAAFVLAEPNAFNWDQQDRLLVSVSAMCILYFVVAGFIRSLDK